MLMLKTSSRQSHIKVAPADPDEPRADLPSSRERRPPPPSHHCALLPGPDAVSPIGLQIGLACLRIALPTAPHFTIRFASDPPAPQRLPYPYRLRYTRSTSMTPSPPPLPPKRQIRVEPCPIALAPKPYPTLDGSCPATPAHCLAQRSVSPSGLGS